MLQNNIQRVQFHYIYLVLQNNIQRISEFFGLQCLVLQNNIQHVFILFHLMLSTAKQYSVLIRILSLIVELKTILYLSRLIINWSSVSLVCTKSTYSENDSSLFNNSNYKVIVNFILRFILPNFI